MTYVSRCKTKTKVSQSLALAAPSQSVASSIKPIPRLLSHPRTSHPTTRRTPTASTTHLDRAHLVLFRHLLNLRDEFLLLRLHVRSLSIQLANGFIEHAFVLAQHFRRGFLLCKQPHGWCVRWFYRLVDWRVRASWDARGEVK